MVGPPFTYGVKWCSRGLATIGDFLEIGKVTVVRIKVCGDRKRILSKISMGWDGRRGGTKFCNLRNMCNLNVY